MATADHMEKAVDRWGRADRVSFEWSMVISVLLATAGALFIVYLGVFWCLSLLGGAVVIPVATWQNIRSHRSHVVVVRH